MAILSKATILIQLIQNWELSTSHPCILLFCGHCLYVLDMKAQFCATMNGEWLRADHNLYWILTSHNGYTATHCDVNGSTTVPVEGWTR